MNFTAKAIITERPDRFVSVTVEWSSPDIKLDRPNVGGWIVSPKYVSRLSACINAQKAYEKIQLCKDVNGKSYINATSAIYARHMNKSLRELGF